MEPANCFFVVLHQQYSLAVCKGVNFSMAKQFLLTDLSDTESSRRHCVLFMYCHCHWHAEIQESDSPEIQEIDSPEIQESDSPEILSSELTVSTVQTANGGSRIKS